MQTMGVNKITFGRPLLIAPRPSGVFPQILSSSVARSVRRYECCPEPYPRLSFAMRVQKKFRVTREVGGIRALRKNPLLYTTVEMSERDRGAIQR